ncbi:MAG: hypothetical protein AB1449_01695 [Chloroflexota bacterium]
MADDFEVGGPPPEESTNRPFIIAATLIGGLLVLSMICLALYALVLAPRQRAARATEAANIILENTQVALAITETEQARWTTPTLTPTRTPPPSPTRTPTQVVVLPSATPTQPVATVDPLTATAAAQATIAALAGGAGTPTATALPETGFADEVGVPSLLMLGAVLIVVVFAARRLRMRTSA